MREDEIAEAVDRIAKEVTESDLVVIVATGAIVFGADLIRAMYREGKDCRVGVVLCSSYGDKRTPGALRMSGLGGLHVEGQRVLVVDDVLDTGATLGAVRSGLLAMGARSVEVAVLVDKGLAPFEADYAGFRVDPGFIYGYGMDNAGLGRGMNWIEVVE